MENQQADVAIIGAGITGIGIARGLAQKGLTTVLIDPAGVAGLTSNSSLRIIHGGIRYLQQLNFKRSARSIKAQQQLLVEYQDLMEELSCLMPLKSLGLKSWLPMQFAAKLYAFLQRKGASSLPRPSVVSSKEVSELISDINNQSARHYFNWFDLQMKDPQNLAISELNKIREKTAMVEDLVVSVEKVDDGYLTTLSHGQKLRTKAVINAAAMGGINIDFKGIQTAHCHDWVSAYNLVFNHQLAKDQSLSQAFTIRGSENREYFVVPRVDSLAIGTFYHAVDQEITNQDIQVIIDQLNASSPTLSLDINQLISVESGEIPCKTPFNGEKSILKSDIIHNDAEYWQVYTPKYTTYQIFGEDISEQVAKKLS